ncbi:MAG: TolC family protein [Nitrospirales bacterium]|nr:TolC family protein [Nitrospira sp.]MDR4500597.1 TolC family protein [Nitrospirales bacterium]
MNLFKQHLSDTLRPRPWLWMATGVVLVMWLGVHAAQAESGNNETSETKERPPELRLSLRGAMNAAVDKNPTVQLYKEQVTQAEYVADTNFGALLPNLSGRVSGARRKFFLGSFGGSPSVSKPIDFYEARASLTQNIFSLSLIQRWRAAKTGVEVANLDSEVTERDTMATVGLVYLESLRAQKAVHAREADVKLNKELLRLAAERKSAGMATSLDVTRARVQLENEHQRLLVARNDHNRAKLNLIRAIGLSFDVQLILTDELTVVPVPKQTEKEALLVAQENRVELQAQKRRKRLAALTLSSVVSERIPSVEASGDVGLIGNQVPNALTTDNVQVLMRVPIFDGGQREGRISENRSLVRQEAIRMQDLQYQVILEVRDALLTIESAQQQVEVAQLGLKLSLQELDLARERFTVGVATNIEVTNAQTSVAQARDNLIEALFTFNAARVNLARAQGRLHDL